VTSSTPAYGAVRALAEEAAAAAEADADSF
jgi:hypothetical protein